jgi:hypothetical protein
MLRSGNTGLRPFRMVIKTVDLEPGRYRMGCQSFIATS